MIVPPLGLGMALPLPSLLLAFAGVLGLMFAARARRRTRRPLLNPAMFCLLALALILAAREMWSLSW